MWYLYLLSFLIVLIPVYLLLALGPKISKERLIYAGTGVVIVAIAGLVLFLGNIDNRVNPNDPEALWARIADVSFAGFMEELLRYPGVRLANKLGLRFSSKGTDPSVLAETLKQPEQWTKIADPHGLGLYFGVAYGLGETFGFYVYPAFKEMLAGEQWVWTDHVWPWANRITAVMAHTALTYLAMIVTVNSSFWRLTVIVHVSSNLVNEVFSVLSHNQPSTVLVIVFTRFSIVAIAYFFLRPRVRYLSPALILLIETLLFLFFVLVGTIAFFLNTLFESNIAPTTIP